MRPQSAFRPLVAMAVALAVMLAPTSSLGARSPAGSKITRPLAKQLQDAGQATFWVRLGEQADLAGAEKASDRTERGASVVAALQQTASRSQKGLIDALKAEKAEFQPFWIVNAVRVTGSAALADRVARRTEVAAVSEAQSFPAPELTVADANTLAAVEWGVSAINADDVWSTFNNTGEGVVVAGIDTGVKFDHPALVNQYRGNVGGGVFNHNYSWWDPARTCGIATAPPCDNVGVGTYTMGTVAGDDGAGNQIGVAPGVKWIDAKGCETSSCSDAALLSAAQWILAPTDVNGQNPKPEMRPHIVVNPWGGGPNNPWFGQAVNAWLASGIFPVFMAGNAGPGCGTASSPGDYLGSYSVGAFDEAGEIADYSGRGSGVAVVKPDIAAPGHNVRSSIPAGNGYSTFNTTASAAAHVAGTVALLWSSAPSLKGNVAATKTLLDDAATDVSDLTCGGTAGDNMVWGEGKLDALAAVEAAPRSDPAPSISINDATVDEGQFGVRVASFTVTRAGSSGGVSSVQFQTTDASASAPSDYVAIPPTTVYFGVGDTTKTLGVQVKGDLAAEPDETFNMVLSNPFNATISDDTGVGTIVNDDSGTPSQFSIDDVSVVEGDSGTRPARFTVSRSGSTESAAAVRYSTSAGTATPGTDFRSRASTLLIFSAGQASRTVDVLVRGDRAVEPDETFNVDLTSPLGASIGDGVGVGTIVNDDTGFSVDDVQATEGDSGTSSLTFTVTRSGDLSGTSTVRVKTRTTFSANVLDYVTVPLTTLTFGPDEATKPVAVTIRGDNTVEGDETFALVLSAPVNARITDSIGIGTILNDD